jgi:integrase
VTVPKKAVELTARQVMTMKAPGLFAVGGVPGLLLQVTPGQGRSWVYRFQLGGKRRDMGLGGVDDLSLAEAREKAREQRRMVLGGVDPIEKRRAERMAKAVDKAKAMTFEQCATAYIQAHQSGWRNEKHRKQWPATLTAYAYPVFGKLPVAALDVGLVMKAIEPIWSAKPETASRLRGRIEAVLDWATVRHYRSGENPARWKGYLESLLPRKTKVRAVEHHAAVDYRLIGAFMGELRQQPGVAARGLEFAILTASRTGEVIGARWDEIDMNNRLWTVPAARMKAGAAHRVPLSGAALELLKPAAACRVNDLVFPSVRQNRPLSPTAFLRVLQGMGRSDLTVHGFRSSFRDWAAEQTNFPSEAAELALAHTVGNKVEAAYRRGDLFEKRRQLAEAWSSFCDGAIHDGNVVNLVRHAAL